MAIDNYHIVLRIDAERAASLSDEEVLERWLQLFTGPLLIRRYRDPYDLIWDTHILRTTRTPAQHF
ncbi:hypothetical protein [Hydrogenophilus thiooxidans]|uniref:hypothetical protein n=1 Tax=Hydrogenophilus thiooxidans TaxID=2820326 RepID=UPI001C21358F|nr:hypothetical protein [Hydrogenophilus thiooxidans]